VITNSTLDSAACRGKDPEIFFDDAILAKAICSLCPVREACLEQALTAERGLSKDRRHGIVGGLNPTERLARDKTCAPEPPAPERKLTRHQRAPCGTNSAYSRHVRNKEPIDDACRIAHSQADRRLRNTGTTKALP
jgi:hypothetical protein